MRAIRPVSTVLFVISITVLLMMGCHGGRTDNPLIELATHTVAAEEPSSTTFASTPVPSTTSSESESASISQPATQISDSVDGESGEAAPVIHQHRYTAVRTPPSCVTQGYTTYTCACGDSYVSNYQDALGHTYGSWITEIQPTTYAEGLQRRSCTRCGHSETAVLPKLTNTSAFAQEVVALVNAERRNAGLSPLTEISVLDDLAQARSREIVTRFEHVRPDGTNPLDGVIHAGYNAAGENIAAGHSTPEAVVDGWMNSPAHRANILSPDFSYIGVGYCESGGYYYWVQIFAGD